MRFGESPNGAPRQTERNLPERRKCTSRLAFPVNSNELHCAWKKRSCPRSPEARRTRRVSCGESGSKNSTRSSARTPRCGSSAAARAASETPCTNTCRSSSRPR